MATDRTLNSLELPGLMDAIPFVPYCDRGSRYSASLLVEIEVEGSVRNKDPGVIRQKSPGSITDEQTCKCLSQFRRARCAIQQGLSLRQDEFRLKGIH